MHLVTMHFVVISQKALKFPFNHDLDVAVCGIRAMLLQLFVVKRVSSDGTISL